MPQKISDDINKILSYARLAPSSHNTQPWKVVVSGNTVTIGFDNARWLNVGDPEKRELFISLGCFAESLILAAEDLGYATNFKFIGENESGVISLNFKKNLARSTEWIKLMNNRRSDRRFFEPKKIPKEFIKQIESIDLGNAFVSVINDKKDIQFLSKMTYDATYSTMSDQNFRSELASWVRHNWTKKPDGMPGYTQGIPGPVSLLAKLVVKKSKGMAKSQAKKDSKRVLHSSAACLLGAKHDKPEDWVDAGRLFMMVCLIALKNDLKTSAVSAATIDPSTSRQIINHFKLSDKPFTLIRMGYKKGTPKAAPRLKVSQFAQS